MGSNDITNEGHVELFRYLQYHPSLSVLTTANHDRLHRNRMGNSACEELKKLLEINAILSNLNIADNRMSNDGLKIIASALNKECKLVILNLSNNDLEG